jgi:hypothetical protein
MRDSFSDSITDEDRLASDFVTHPYHLHLSRIEKLLQFYDPESDTDPGCLLTLSTVLLSILSFPNQDRSILSFFISNTRLNSISGDVLSFSIHQRYRENGENLLTSDCPLVLSAIRFIASFACGKRTPKADQSHDEGASQLHADNGAVQCLKSISCACT